jgi:hypothetical protein
VRVGEERGAPPVVRPARSTSLGDAILNVILRGYICRRVDQREFTRHCEISEVTAR